MAITAPRALMRYAWPRKRARDLWTAFYRVTRGRFFVGRRLGYRLLFDADNVLDRYLLAFGFYEQEQLDCLLGAARDAHIPGQRSVFLDVGAHWGTYALVALKTDLFERIVAVEADSRNLGQLHANLFLNGLTDRIDVVAAAAAAAPGEIRFGQANALSRNVSRVAVAGEPKGGAVCTVPAVRLDDIEPLSGGLVVAKVDVEGYEAEVMQGMSRLLAENRCILQVEVFGPTLAAFSAGMVERGFSLFAEVGNDRYYRNF